jgi:hypothetical protein
MAASLRSTRPVAKAVLLNRVGRIGHRLSSTILTVKMSGGILFQRSGQIPIVARPIAFSAEIPGNDEPPSYRAREGPKGTATLLVSLGFEALATTSFGMANALSAPMARAPFSRAELRQKLPGNR